MKCIINGTSNEEVLLMLIDRMEYLNEKLPCFETKESIYSLKKSLVWQWIRNARHKRDIVESKSIDHKANEVENEYLLKITDGMIRKNYTLSDIKTVIETKVSFGGIEIVISIHGNKRIDIVDENIIIQEKVIERKNFISVIAKVCHEANRAYCENIGDDSQLPWNMAPEWQRESARKGVQFHLHNPDAKPEDSHNSWLKEKEADGWKYGEVKNVEKKEHPCFMPYEQLPIEQQKKDALFISVVRALV
jgi:RyR domain